MKVETSITFAMPCLPGGVGVAFSDAVSLTALRNSFVIPPLSPLKVQWWLRDLLPQTFVGKIKAACRKSPAHVESGRATTDADTVAITAARQLPNDKRHPLWEKRSVARFVVYSQYTH